MIGLTSTTSRAADKNDRASPIVSMKIRMLLVYGSSPKKSIRSPQPISSIDPTETKALRPTLALGHHPSTTAPTALLWLRNAILPGCTTAWVTVAFRSLYGRIKPRLLGPMMRILPRRASLSNSCSSRAPSGPVSLKPAEITIAALTPASAHSQITLGTVGAGVTTTARSIGSGIEATFLYAFIPSTRRRMGSTT